MRNIMVFKLPSTFAAKAQAEEESVFCLDTGLSLMNPRFGKCSVYIAQVYPISLHPLEFFSVP